VTATRSLRACGRDRVEADVGEEDQGGGVADAAEALGREGREVAAAEGRDSGDDEEREDGELEDHHRGVRPRALAHSDQQERHDGDHEHHGGEVDHAALARRLGDRVRQGDAEDRVQELFDVAAPADRRHREAVLDQQVPADDPGDDLAERRVGVRVRRARDRDGRGQLGVAERREDAGDRGEDEAEDDRRPGVADRLADDDEDAGADDPADAEGGEVHGADRARCRPR
jgi:hypothetical protein